MIHLVQRTTWAGGHPLTEARVNAQPAKDILRSRGFSVRGLSRRYGLPHEHVRRAIDGVVAPTVPVAIALTDATGLPVTDLFDEYALGRLR